MLVSPINRSSFTAVVLFNFISSCFKNGSFRFLMQMFFDALMFLLPAFVSLSIPPTAVYPREPSLDTLLIPQHHELESLRFVSSYNNASVSRLPPDLIDKIISDHTSVDVDALQSVMEAQLQSKSLYLNITVGVILYFPSS